MRAQLKIEYEDYYELCRVHERLQGRERRRSPVTIAAYLACGLGFVFIVTRDSFVVWLAPALLIAMGLTVLIAPQLQDGRELKRAFDRYAERLRSIEMVTDDASIVFTSPAGDRQLHWSALSEFHETRRLLVLRSSQEDVMIAKRTFADAAELEAFRAEIRSRIPEKALGFPVVRSKAGEA